MNWDATVKDLGPRLQRYFRLRFPPHLAADLVQETLIRLVDKVENGAYDPAKGTVVAYAFGLAHYVMLEARRVLSLSQYRNAGDEKVDTAVAAGPSPEDEVEAQERSAELRRAIAELPDAEREVVSLLLDKDLSLADIGAILGMPTGTVKSHVHRAKMRLRTALAGAGRNESAASGRES